MNLTFHTKPKTYAKTQRTTVLPRSATGSADAASPVAVNYREKRLPMSGNLCGPCGKKGQNLQLRRDERGVVKLAKCGFTAKNKG
jgi:hypothetical protein